MPSACSGGAARFEMSAFQPVADTGGLGLLSTHCGHELDDVDFVNDARRVRWRWHP
jgi:hypothetical protein